MNDVLDQLKTLMQTVAWVKLVIKGKNPFKQSENLPIIEVIGESTECTVR
jgi:hypothetical protein